MNDARREYVTIVESKNAGRTPGRRIDGEPKVVLARDEDTAARTALAMHHTETGGIPPGDIYNVSVMERPETRPTTRRRAKRRKHDGRNVRGWTIQVSWDPETDITTPIPPSRNVTVH